MTNLKPCPFCGGEAERIDIPAEHDDIENAGASCIQCSRCAASTALHFDRKENLESSWNDRKPAPLAAMGLSEKYLSLESNDCLRPPVREGLLLRLDDLLRLLNAPGDWGYGTKLGELTKLLLIARDDLRQNRS